MSKPKDKLTNFWVSNINQLLTSLNLETIQTDDFTNLLVNSTTDKLTITVICNTKMLVLNLDDSTKKFTGGWKHF